jgi:DNA-binding response OmpR family regulator
MAKILVVDDEPDVVEIVKFRLEKDGHTVLTAPNGEQGLASAIGNSPDLVILDVMMPGIDGFEVAYQMKNNPRTKDMPVVMLTAKTDLGSISKGWGMDVDNYVTKPFNVDELAKTVKAVLVYRGRLSGE